MKTYGRTTISVPVEMIERMKLVNAHARVNWSGLAVMAFEQEIEVRLKEIEHKQVLERLRSAVKGKTQCYEIGVKMATEWMHKEATVQQIEDILTHGVGVLPDLLFDHTQETKTEFYNTVVKIWNEIKDQL